MGLKNCLVKVRKGGEGEGGRKGSQWVQLQADLLVEFDRLRRTGLKFSPAVLRLLVCDLLRNSQSEHYKIGMVDRNLGKTLLNHITDRWVRAFMERFNILSRRQTGKLMTSPAKQEIIERSVAFHLRYVVRSFSCREICRNRMLKTPMKLTF